VGKASIIIPTYNAGELFTQVLEGIFLQSEQPAEVIVIDSSSSDGTDERAKAFPVKFQTISKSEFGHGKTRNYGARIAEGDYVVFLTQDAVPRDESWLKNIIRSLDGGTAGVAGSFSRQIARDHAVPMEKFFYSKFYPGESKLIAKSDVRLQRILFSNASSAMRRSFILDHPFDEDILMSEDLAWAYRVLDEGYRISYEADSLVTHSHDASFVLLFKRYFDFGVSHVEIRMKGEQDSVYFGKGLVTVLEELKYLATNGHTSWLPRSVSYNAAKFLGLLVGRNHRLLPRSVKRRLTSSYKEHWA
jgi:rhamnosyltransferase